jgi:pyridoxamine 5'-phosphate oxidase-like protein
MLLEDHHLIEQKKVSNLIEEGTKADLVESDRLPGSEGDHRLQEKYGKTTHARAFYQHQVLNHLNSAMRAFLARQEMMFVATSDAKGEADSSFRAGHPGSVKVLDERTVVYPEYRGNSVMAAWEISRRIRTWHCYSWISPIRSVCTSMAARRFSKTTSF